MELFPVDFTLSLLVVFHTVAPTGSIGLKTMAKNYLSMFLTSEQKLPDCPTRATSRLSVFIGLLQPTHNEVTVA